MACCVCSCVGCRKRKTHDRDPMPRPFAASGPGAGTGRHTQPLVVASVTTPAIATVQTPPPYTAGNSGSFGDVFTCTFCQVFGCTFYDCTYNVDVHTPVHACYTLVDVLNSLCGICTTWYKYDIRYPVVWIAAYLCVFCFTAVIALESSAESVPTEASPDCRNEDIPAPPSYESGNSNMSSHTHSSCCALVLVFIGG